MDCPPPRRLTIATLTFRRPADITTLLPLLIAQAREVSAAGDGSSGLSIEILVVDNDPDASARGLVEGLAEQGVRYECEPTPGIAAARNRALDEAAQSDLLIFIDDDERPHPSWLRLLLETQARNKAAAVAGAVVSEFDGELDPWLSAGRFFERKRRATDSPIQLAATNNLLLDLRVTRELGLRFDPDFGLSGGEDTLFTRSIAAGGGRMFWCDEAIVTDWVPRSRMNKRWVLLRAMSSGNSVSRVGLRLATGRRQRASVRLAACRDGAPRVVIGAGQWLLGTVTRAQRHQARGLRTIARGAGMIAGAFGYSYQEYKR